MRNPEIDQPTGVILAVLALAVVFLGTLAADLAVRLNQPCPHCGKPPRVTP